MSSLPPDDAPAHLEIDPGKKRRWVGLLAYLLLFMVVAAVLVFVLVRLWTPVALAIGIVVFMAGYMLLMGYLASRNIDRRE